MIHLKKKYNTKLLLGIDLGTTYSLAVTMQKEHIILLLDKKKRYLLPSVVHYSTDSISVGWKALEQIIQDPSNTISSVKRLLGRSMKFIKKEFPFLPYSIKENIDGSIVFHTNFGLISPIDVSSHILQSLKKRALILFNQEIDASIITVPAYFNNIQKSAIKQAAVLAKINLVRLLNEPTAAAVAYGLQIKKKGIIIIYDLGGGTFDISILKLNKAIFEVLATSGDSNLGGDDFDLALANYIYKKSNLTNTYDNFFQSLLFETAKKTKLQLTQYNQVEINLFNWKGYITRKEFNSIIIRFIKKTLLICSKLLEEVNLSTEQIEEVIMVGGSTRIPLVYSEVAKFFKKQPLNSIDPDRVVAIGAAIQVNTLFNSEFKNKTVLLDVMPLSLGIEVMGGFVEKIIVRNTSVPISKTKEFTTYKDNQTAILIHVVQGERELVKDCISLSRFTLKGIKPQKAGLVRILVTFQVDTDGLINITVLDKSSNQEKEIQIDNNVILKKVNVSNIVKQSLKHSQEDYSFRIKEETKLDSIRTIKIISEYLQEDKQLISHTEFEKIKNVKNQLEESIKQNNFFSMKTNLQKLNDLSKDFLSLKLRKTINGSLITNILKEDV